MMTALTLAGFALVAFIGIATPGPTVLLALANGSRFGMRRAVAIGLGALLAASVVWFAIVKWIGVFYLAFLGVALLRSRATLDHSLRQAGGGLGAPRALFLKSFLVAVTNPKGYLFFSAFLPQFIAADAPLLPQYVALAAVFVALDFLVMTVYALLGARAVRLLKQSGAKWLDRICGGALLALAGSLAFYRRAGA